MSIELIIIGNEVLAGHTINTNLSFIGLELAKSGYYLSRETVLPDEHEVLVREFKEALSRSKLVIVSGGLGPTLDDKTRQAAAFALNSGLHLDPMILRHLEERYGKNNLNVIEDQATVPDKSIALLNTVGTAPGLIFEGESTLLLLPGVPNELRAMFTAQVIPYIIAHFPLKQEMHSKILHLMELSENVVDPFLRSLEGKFPGVKCGIYPGLGTLSVSLTTFLNAAALEAPFRDLEREFATNCFEAAAGLPEEAVQRLFIEKGWTLSCAESCTGGALAARITSQPGASNYFLGSVVSYSNALKSSLLDIPETLIHQKGAVSKEVAVKMAENVLKLTGSDFSLAVTGIAGPAGGTSDKPVGTVWCAVAHRDAGSHSWLLQARGPRHMIITRSVNSLLNNLLTYTKNYNV